MTQVPQDDEPLIQFLKQHRPTPPATATPLDEGLMQLIARERKRTTQKHDRLFWLIPGAIAVMGLATWLGLKGSHPSPQMAVQPEELESFVVDSWNGSVEELSNTTNETWLILADSQTHD